MCKGEVPEVDGIWQVPEVDGIWQDLKVYLHEMINFLSLNYDWFTA